MPASIDAGFAQPSYPKWSGSARHVGSQVFSICFTTLSGMG
ncbi:hypothetical protein [Bradyrhizobium embrapense]|nr:hypothetical protein [Bradyrhizobium embrapense]